MNVTIDPAVALTSKAFPESAVTVWFSPSMFITLTVAPTGTDAGTVYVKLLMWIINADIGIADIEGIVEPAEPLAPIGIDDISAEPLAPPPLDAAFAALPDEPHAASTLSISNPATAPAEARPTEDRDGLARAREWLLPELARVIAMRMASRCIDATQHGS